MNITFSEETYKAIRKAGAKSPVFHEERIYRDVDVESHLILPKDRKLIQGMLSKPEFYQFIENRRVIWALRNVETIESGKPVKIKRLTILAEAIKKAVSVLPNKFVFYRMKRYQAYLPFFVREIEYSPSQQFKPENVSISLVALHRGDRGEGDSSNDGSELVSFHKDNLKGDTLEKILEAKGLLLETPDLMREYEEDLKRYYEISPKVGCQYLAEGWAAEITFDKDGDERWGDYVPMIRDGRPSKAVVDDREDFGSETAHVSCEFWDADASKDEEDQEAKDYPIPIHPVVRVFQLFRQRFAVIHVSNLKDYVYDDQIGGKIVLPQEHRKLVNTLVVGTVKKMDDIVKGKALGVIVLCTGKPGTGKTLTAEVYSEVAKRPLYMVQCSQLGIDPDDLEKNLSTVLDRANRWGAILLLDEADVYIHERGENVKQNAIVGVFLRLLEYYNGILFMNTNRDEVVDDAIMSRVTAHVKYSNPSPHDASRIWVILFSQYAVKYDNKLLADCVGLWTGISGRNIRQIVRLGKMMADQEGRAPTIQDFRFAAQYQNLDDDSTEKSK